MTTRELPEWEQDFQAYRKKVMQKERDRLAEMQMQKHAPDRKDVAIMLALKRYPPASMTECAEAAGISYPTVQQRFRWLKKAGYIHRAPNAPPRAPRSIILTQKGFEYLEELKNF